jgi:hypothetical protein
MTPTQLRVGELVACIDSLLVAGAAVGESVASVVIANCSDGDRERKLMGGEGARGRQGGGKGDGMDGF